MQCPFCANATQVYNSRSTHQNTQVWRRRKCKSCHKAFTTKEKVDWTGQVEVKTPQDSAPYSRERLLLSIAQASKGLELPAAVVSELTDTTELALQHANFFGAASQHGDTITQITTEILSRYSPHISLQYINHVYGGKPPLELVRTLTVLEKRS